MPKKLLLGLASIAILLPLAAFLVPSLYAMALFLAVLLPVVCSASIVRDAKERGELDNFGKLLPKFFLAMVVLPCLLLAFAAPLRAILLAVLSFFPESMAKFNDIHSVLYEQLTAVFGAMAPYWLDVYWGVFSLATIFMIAFCSMIRRNRLLRQVEILPTATVRSVAVGLAELKGKAVPIKKRGAGPIMRSWLESTDDGVTSKTHAEPFYLDDGTGRILVDPQDVSINHDDDFFGIDLHQAILKQLKKASGFPESRLMPGDTVYLVGTVQVNRDRTTYENEDVVIKPQKSSWLSMNFYDLFFVSNVSENALLAGFRKSVKRGWRNVLIGMAFGAWLSAFALTNIMQMESLSLDGAPEYLRLISPPTTLEREISVWELGQRTTLEFVEMLEEGDQKKTDAIMKAFREHQLLPLALPTLKEQAADIDHPGFGIANHWLAKLEQAPRGWRGIEFFSDYYVNESEAVVLRLSTRFADNRLIVSYRAYVGAHRKKRDDTIRTRNVVIELMNKESGEKYTARFEADFGFNNADDVEAFEFLYPGEYELDVYLETYYRSGFYNLGSRRRSPMTVRLEE